MRRSAVPRSHVKFLDEVRHGEEHQLVVTKTEKVVVAGAVDGSHFVSTATTKTVDAVPVGRDSPRFPNLHAMFTHKPKHMQEDLLEARRVTEEKVVVQETAKTTSVERSIDMEAEEYIRRKRHSLEQQRLMSMKAT